MVLEIDCTMKRMGYITKCLKEKCVYYDYDCEEYSTNGELD